MNSLNTLEGQTLSLPELEASVKAKLLAGELHQALALLNQQGSHRFTGLFACEETFFRNAFLYDREQPGQLRMDELIPYEASYCQFTCETQKTFIIVDAANDPCFEGHPSRLRFRSYVAVPIFNSDGSLWGTLCYFDTEANAVAPAQIALLELVAGIIRRRLGEPADRVESWDANAA